MTFDRLTDQQIRALASQNKIPGWKVALITWLIDELKKLGILVTSIHETSKD